MRTPRALLISAASLSSFLAICLALVLPTAAPAAPVVFGSSLGAPPNIGSGCEVKPTLNTSSGDYTSGPGAADCTWWQSGVFGSLTDPRTGSVPGIGSITRLDVRSGNNPTPLRVVVIRQLGTPGAGSDCCFFISETPPLQPAANTVTSFPLNVPVVHASAVGGIRADDYIGISAGAGGELPLRVVGSTNTFDFTTPGSVNAAFLYPRFGSQPNDGGGGRREEGIGGIEVLVRWTFCATGDGTCQPGGNAVPAIPAPPIAPTLGAQLARIRKGSALIKLVCQGNLLCEGQLELLNLGGIAKKKKITSYGKKAYSIPAGGKKTLKVKLNKKGKRLLRHKRRAKIGIRLTPKGGAATSAKLTLKR